MYAALVKKLSIAKGKKITKISSNRFTNCMAMGGTDGFIQLLDFDFEKVKKNSPKENASISLDQHIKTLTIITFNESYNKLTTCDESGQMVVWKYSHEKWETEMLNNREASQITDIKWSKQGQFLCFI